MCNQKINVIKWWCKTLAIVRNLVNNAKFILEQAIDAAGIQGEEREAILELLQKKEKTWKTQKILMM